MDFKQIQELIKMINKSNIGELTVEQKDFRITIKQKEEQITQVLSAPVQAMPIQPTITQPASVLQPPPAPAAEKAPPKTESSAENYVTIKSPMIGTFYRAPSPESASYVEIGAEVNPETVVCIIEAMKVMNEIKAEAKGVITEVVVENAKPVEFGQPLFKLRPT